MQASYRTLWCLTVLLVGCGGPSDAPQLADVHGTAIWQGKPLDNASVVFTPEVGPIAVGVTNEQGEFQLLTQGKSGASLGPHRVTIAAYEATQPVAAVAGIENPDGENVAPAKSRIPAKFNDLKQSGLTATVTKDTDANQFKFDLK